MDSNIKTDETINLIRYVRRRIRFYVSNELSKHYNIESLHYRQKLNIMSDALVYLSLSRSQLLANYDITKDNVVKSLKNEFFCSDLVKNILKNTVTFDDSLRISANMLNIKLDKRDDMQELLQDSELKNKPDIRLAIQMYLLKGHFNWVPDNKSEFKQFLFNDSKQSLTPDSDINCWEAVMYGMMKTDILSRDDLKKYYKGNVFDTEEKLIKWFDSRNQTCISAPSPNVSVWKEILKKNTYFIMINDLAHDMISIPYSQKQLLKMMITRDFNEEPTRAKIYSHWIKWTGGSLGTVPKHEMDLKLKRSTSYRPVKISKLEEFVLRGKKLMHNSSKVAQDHMTIDI